MSRCCRLPLVFVLLFALLGATSVVTTAAPPPPPSSAPAPAAFAAIPLALPLAKAPVGSWAEYRLGEGDAHPMTIRLALVSRTGKVAKVETWMEGGPLGVLGRTTLVCLLDVETGRDLEPDKHALQMGSNPPMYVPTDMGLGQAMLFRKPDPKDVVGHESVTVPEATFAELEHLRTPLANGRFVDAWISKAIPPFGLVKMNAGIDPQGRPVTMELVKHGAGAKASLTQKALRFDRVALLQQLQPLIDAQRAALSAQAAAARAGAGGAGPGRTP